MNFVLDSYSIISFLENEPGADRVADLIRKGKNRESSLYLSIVNWGEVYYIIYRSAGKSSAVKALRTLESLPIEIVSIDLPLTLEAAELKAEKKMSYADCFAAALALQKMAALVTGDKEFKQVQNKIKILWL